jgi:hypothetical protein
MRGERLVQLRHVLIEVDRQRMTDHQPAVSARLQKIRDRPSRLLGVPAITDG